LIEHVHIYVYEEQKERELDQHMENNWSRLS